LALHLNWCPLLRRCCRCCQVRPWPCRYFCGHRPHPHHWPCPSPCHRLAR